MITLQYHSQQPTANSEIRIETVVDGVTVRAIAKRTVRSHRVEILEPFQASASAHGNIPVFAIAAYRKSLEGRDLYRDSVELVEKAYREFMRISEPDEELMDAYELFRRARRIASQKLIETTRMKQQIVRENRRLLKSGQMDSKIYAGNLRMLKELVSYDQEELFNLERKFVLQWFDGTLFEDALLLDTAEKAYLKRNPPD